MSIVSWFVERLKAEPRAGLVTGPHSLAHSGLNRFWRYWWWPQIVEKFFGKTFYQLPVICVRAIAGQTAEWTCSPSRRPYTSAKRWSCWTLSPLFSRFEVFWAEEGSVCVRILAFSALPSSDCSPLSFRCYTLAGSFWFTVCVLPLKWSFYCRTFH